MRIKSNLKTFKLPKSPHLVVASDVHVRTEHDERYLLLCQLVEEALRVGARGLVLNGDIFDFFFAWSPYFREKYARLLTGLDALSRTGADVWFVEGNHEFGMDALKSRFNFQVISGDGKVWVTNSGQKILIAHGDLLRPDPWYNLFRAIVRSNVVNVAAYLFPQRLLDRLTLWFATTSRKKDKYRVLNHAKIIDCGAVRLAEFSADQIVFGHFHYPYDEDLGGGKRLLSVASWDEPSCLVLGSDGSFIRVIPEMS